MPVKKYLRRSSSHVHCGNATIWPNHRMMRAVIKKKMMVLPAKFARSPGYNCRRNVEIGFNAIYGMNISAQSAITRDFSADENFFSL